MPYQLEVDRIFFLAAITAGDFNTARTIYGGYPPRSQEREILLSQIEPQSGRNMISLAMSVPIPLELIFFTDELQSLEIQANLLKRRDHAGFSGYELILNPIPFEGPPDFRARHFIEEALMKLSAILVAYHMPISIITNTEEIERYLSNNPHLTSIGFLVETPNILKTHTFSAHITPIFYHRTAQDTEYFIMLDTTYIRIIPLIGRNGVKRKIIFNPFPLQCTDAGCCRASVLLLIYCFLDPELILFCEKNSKKIDRSYCDLTRPTPPDPCIGDNSDENFINHHLTASIEIMQTNLQKMNRLLILESRNNDLVKDIHYLINLTPWMLLFIEHYGVWRALKQRADNQVILEKMVATKQICFFRHNSIDCMMDDERLTVLDPTVDFNTYLYQYNTYTTITVNCMIYASTFLTKFQMGYLYDESLTHSHAVKFFSPTFIPNISGGQCEIITACSPEKWGLRA